ncbi:MAG: hypothetical protein HYZ53_18595 [Planctomycetes bacterium]|nr:hypothetical protein [Planctomycetota bacterium]
MRRTRADRRPKYAGCRGQEMTEYAIVTAFAIIGLVGVLAAFEDAIIQLCKTSSSLVTMDFP